MTILLEDTMCTCTEGTTRRQVLSMMAAAATGFAMGSLPLGWAAAQDKKPQRLLFFTKSQGFQHPCITRKGDSLSHAEKVLVDLGKKHGVEVTATKDGRIFTEEGLAPFDAIMFYTTGDLTQSGTDKSPPMPSNGKELLLKTIADGKGFVGSHCASDTFHSGSKVDPYIALLGGEFVAHGAQQKAKIRVAGKEFPGAKNVKDFEMFEEWYALKNFAPDMHVILVQDTQGMQGDMYKQAPYPETWARMHGKGRVFFTSMGHREDVWTNDIFQQILLSGLAWAMKNVDAEIKPNLKEVTPDAASKLAVS
jgi:uncharacterized protein